MSDATTQNEKLSETYSRLSDDRLMQLSIDGGLTAEAQVALATEMHKRSLGLGDVIDLKDWEEERARPAPVRRTFLGYGVKFVGRKFLSAADEDRGIFVATRFVILMGMPMIPTGSFRVDQRARGFPQIHNRIALQIDQVWSGLWPTILLGVFCGALGVLSAYLTDKNRRPF